jgi:hypothetical protein
MTRCRRQSARWNAEQAASDLRQRKDQINENSRQQKLAAFTRPATYEIHEKVIRLRVLKVGKAHPPRRRLEIADL